MARVYRKIVPSILILAQEACFRLSAGSYRGALATTTTKSMTTTSMTTTARTVALRTGARSAAAARPMSKTASTTAGSSINATRRRRRNVTIFGPPGSGKGFYGKPLAEQWGVPLFTASSILRSEHADSVDLDSGTLVDCQVVSDAIVRYLSSFASPEKGDGPAELKYSELRRGGRERQWNSYILDGFPRTIEQIQLMEETWPESMRVHVALQLDVPDFVCEAKMLGRRHCTLCDTDYNIASVHRDGFDLPAQLTSRGCGRCNPDEHWTMRRDDSSIDIIRERIRMHRQHEQPILDYYESRGRLFRCTPYNGIDDLPDMKAAFEEWLENNDKSR